MAEPSGGSVGASGNPLIDGPLQGNSWTFPSQPRVITYSLNQTGVAGTAWTPTLSAATDAAFAAWEVVANVDFQRVVSGTYTWESTADIALGLTGTKQTQTWGAIGTGYFPNSADNDFDRADIGPILGQTFTPENYAHPEGDIYLDDGSGVYDYLDPGGLGLSAILHEIGHALGLKHPHDSGGTGMPTFAQLGIGSMDNDSYTVMSYKSPFGFADSGNPSTPMVLDILAIQYIYGANMSYHTGDDVYTFGQDDVYTIWDAGGIDTIDASLHAGIFLMLDAGSTNMDEDSWSTLGIAYGVTIENAIGSNWQDFIWGNEVDNTIWGGGGGDNLYGGLGNDLIYGGDANPYDPGYSDDHMNGGAGADTLIGGTGNDIYDVDDLNAALEDTLIEGVDGGVDRIFSKVTLSLADYVNIEGIYLMGDDAIDGYGNESDNHLYGNLANNMLVGGLGNDILTDAGNKDQDIFIGGLGDDIYGGNAGETIIELEGEGIDTVRCHEQKYTLGDNLEILEIYGSNGVSGYWEGTGNALDNKITTTNFKDILDGKGGNDTLIGGFGNDIYYIDSEGDHVVEDFYDDGGFFVNQIDEVRSTVSINSIAHVELFTLLGSGDLSAYGNSLDNVITGNAGANVLDGKSGKDKIIFGDEDVAWGGAGKDTFSFITTESETPLTATIADFSFGETLSWTTLLPLAGAATAISWPISLGTGATTTLNQLEYFSDGVSTILNFGLDEVSGADFVLTLTQWIEMTDLLVKAEGSTITVTHTGVQNLAPTDISLSSNTVLDAATPGTVIGTLNATDVDETDTFSYEILDDAGGRFAIDGNTLMVSGVIDYEWNHDYSVKVRVTDSAGNSYDETLSIKVNDVNDNAPHIFGFGTIDFGENKGTKITQITASDQDFFGQSVLTFSISGGADKDQFVIDPQYGWLSFVKAPDFENPTSASGENLYVVEVKVSDGLFGDTHIFNVKILDTDEPNQAPTDISLSASSVIENAALGTVIGTLSAIDSNSKGAPTFTLIDSAGGRFSIDGDELVVASAIDREAAASYNVTVRATDSAGAFYDETLTVSVADVNDNVPVIASNGGGASVTISVIENISAITKVQATDGDATSVVSYAITGGADKDLFQINTATGALSFKQPSDFEHSAGATPDNLYIVEVTASDGTFSDSQTINVTVTNQTGRTITGTAAGDQITDISTLPRQTTFEDDIISGLGGNDLIQALGGNDRLDGGVGADTLVGGAGSDTYVVNAAGDVVSETIAAGGGVDTVESSITFTLATRVNVENLELKGLGNISGTGNALANLIEGNAGNNKIDGGSGNDVLFGQAGNDTILGGLGNDTIAGGLGADQLTGGGGRDFFDFDTLLDAGDTITGFVKGAAGDVLDLRELLDSVLYAGSDPFADQILSFSQSNGNTVVRIDANGAGAGGLTDLVTILNVSLTAADTNNFLV